MCVRVRCIKIKIGREKQGVCVSERDMEIEIERYIYRILKRK